MSREEELNFRVTADTKQAATNVDDLAADVSDLEDKPHDVEVTADTAKADAAAKQLDKRLDGLTDEQKRIVLEVAAKDAQRDLDRLNRDLAQAHKFGDDEIAIKLSARGDAQAKLQAIQAEARELDSVDPTVEVKVKGGDELRSLIDKLDEHTGGLGSRLSALGVGAPAIAGVAALVGGLALAADHEADAAIEAGNLAALTGDSVEMASRFNALWKQTGADTKDLQDVLLQMNGVLATNSQLAEELGINLNDGATVGQRFEQVSAALDKIPDAAHRSQIASQVFGEEGVRQYNALRNSVESVSAALNAIPSGLVFSEKDVDQAREMKRRLSELSTEAESFAASFGSVVVPAVSKGFGLINATFAGAENFGAQTRAIFTGIADGQLRIETGNQKIVRAWQEAGEAAAGFNVKLLDGLDTFDAVRAKVLEVTGSETAANLVALQWKDTIGAQIEAQKEHAAEIQEVRLQTDGLRAGTAEAERATRDATEALEEQTSRIQEVRLQTDGLATDLSEAAAAQAGLEANTRLVNDALAGERDRLSREGFLLDLQDQLVRVGEAEAAVADAAKKGGEDAATARRNQQREVIRLQGMVLDLVGMYDDIPAEKVTRIIAAINSGDLEKIDAAIAELEAGIQVPVEFVMPQTRAAFDSANIALGRGSIPAISFAPPQVIDQSTHITNQPSGTTPESQHQNTNIFNRRGGRT